jgi:HSP20 family protein
MAPEVVEMIARFDLFPDLEGLFRRRGHAAMPLDAYRRSGMFYLHFDVPGVDADSIELTIDKDVLTVKAERVWTEEEGDELLACERPQGTFERRVLLGANLDREHVEARYENGVLTVRMPVVEEVKPYKVPIDVSTKAEEVKPAA